MKKVTLTNATVIPFYKNNPNDADEIVKIIRPREGSTFSSNIVSFNVETKTVDSADSKAKLFERCTIYAKTDDQIAGIQSTVKNGAILEVEGYEKRTKSEKDGKYYTNIIVKSITPISAGIEEAEPNFNESPAGMPVEDDLPF